MSIDSTQKNFCQHIIIFQCRYFRFRPWFQHPHSNPVWKLWVPNAQVFKMLFKFSPFDSLAPQEEHQKHQASIPVSNLKAWIHISGHKVIHENLPIFISNIHWILPIFYHKFHRKSVQRGMAVSQLRGDSNSDQEPLVRWVDFLSIRFTWMLTELDLDVE